MSLAEQLVGAMAARSSKSVEGHGLIVKLLRLRHDSYPGRSAHGVLPLVVVGHESMGESEWRDWVRLHGIPYYGAAITEKMIRDGIDLREMMPTAAFGRQLLDGRRHGPFRYLRRAESVLTMVEKWPSLYNSIANEIGEEQMTLGSFVDHVMSMPSPRELGAGAYTTLGDILMPAGGMILPTD